MFEYIHCGLITQNVFNLLLHKYNPPLPFLFLQVRVHKQRQKELSGLSKDLQERIEVAQHLHCWQNLLTAHSLELAELINNLDEEAAADIRKVLLSTLTFTNDSHNT